MVRTRILLWVMTFAVFVAAGYGGVRSSDGEIQFRTAERLAFHSTWAVEKELESWPGFGLATGIDGNRYSVFSPLQPLALASVLRFLDPVAQRLAQSGFAVPNSPYVDSAGADKRLEDSRRFVLFPVQAIVSASAVLFFYLIALSLSGSSKGALFAAIAFGWATPVWTYSGTFFSEPWALTLQLLSILMLLRSWSAGSARSGLLLLSGFFSGLAVTAHISAALWVPFALLLCSVETRRFRDLFSAQNLRRIVVFALGLLPLLSALLWFNFMRFGNVLETGRFVDPRAATTFGYGRFILPDESLLALILSPGKGLLVYMPICLLGLLAWPTFYRRWPWMAKVTLAAGFFRLVFIASRSDWHGGFGLGPRYLVLLLPLVLLSLPFAFAAVDRQRERILFVLLALCICEQAYFANVEIFSFYHSAVHAADAAGVDIFENNRIYSDWSLSPFSPKARLEVAPWVARRLGLSFVESVGLLFAAVALGSVALFRAVRAKDV